MGRPKKPHRSWRYRIARNAIELLIVVVIVWFAGCSMIDMPGKSYKGQLPPLSDGQRELSAALKAHVVKLADEIGPRSVDHAGKLEETAAYITEALTRHGYTVTRQEYEVEKVTVANLIAERRGATKPDEIVVIGAHYDSVTGCPGANDNASGVAALIECARLATRRTPQRTIRFVAFTNEEPPFFQTPRMGSLVYAKACKQRGDNIAAMMSFDGIGYYSDDPGTQKYPFPFSVIYPSTGNFIGFIANHDSRALVRQAIGTFREHARFPSEGAAVPGFIEGVGWSDHWAFWQCGYKAFLITDSLPFRYEHYHRITDTPEKLDYDRMARLVEGMDQVIEALERGDGP